MRDPAVVAKMQDAARRVAATKRRYKHSDSSCGMPESVPEDHVATFDESNRVAVATGRDDDDDDDVPACAFRLPDASDERRFAHALRRRAFVFWWLLCVAARLAESTGVVESGLGTSAASRHFTAMFMIFSSGAATAGKRFQRACLERTHLIALAYMLLSHFVRVVRISGLSDGEREFQMRWLYATLRSSPAYYVMTALQGFCVAFMCDGHLAFQAFYAALHVGVCVAVSNFAGADFREVAPSVALWVASIAAGNGVTFCALKPLWFRAQRGASEALKRRVAQLGREKERVTWEWQLDVSRLARPRADVEPDDGDDEDAAVDASLLDGVFGDRSERPGEAFPV